MKTLSRLLLVLALLWLGIILFHEAGTENSDPTKVILVFGGIIAVALLLGSLVAVWLVPALGDIVGNFFFNPGEKAAKDPHATAMARMAQGDYQGAIDEYHNAFAQNPDDVLALSEIAHIYCDKLKQPEPARELLEEALDRELPMEDSTFLLNRLVDVCWKSQHDLVAARGLLLKIVQEMPETKYSANAQHRLRELEHAV